MDTADFLRFILAPDGYQCICIKLEKGYHHRFFQSCEDAAQFALAQDKLGKTVYHACATFIAPTTRKQVNAAYLKSFFSDVDIGDDKPYRTRAEASAALTRFLAATGLPPPTIVNSGAAGMHLYWVLEDALVPEEWKQHAIALRELCKQHGFHIDPARAADSSSVLRPPGTHNRKHGSVHTVEIASLAPPVWIGDLKPLLGDVSKEYLTVQRSSPRLLQHASAYQERPSDAHKIALECAQIDNVRVNKGNVGYYPWLYAIWTLRHTIQGDDVCHEWSSGHPHYSFAETQRKLDEDKGPITCAKFAEHNDLCKTCKYWGKISTPLQLGRDYSNQPQTINGVESASCFLNTDSGLYFVTEDKGGQPLHKLISSVPIHLTSVCRGERNPDWSLIFELDLPHAGKLPLSVPSGVFFSAQGMPELHRLGAIIHDGDLMRKYVREKVDEYNKKDAPQTRYEQMGWKDHDNSFLVGTKLYTQTGITDCAVSPEIERRARMLGPRGGSLPAWSAAANQLFAEGCEPHSFALCCSFGAVLMHFFSEEGGAIINLVSEQSATGKTTGLEAVASVWGEQDGIRLTDDDTRVSRGLLLGALGNLPCIFDELHKRDPDSIRQFCIMFTNGRDKLRSSPSGSLREPAGDWQTILVLGSNLSIVDILQAKGAEEAQAFRVLEFSCEQNFSNVDGDKLRRQLKENAGWAGHVFLQALMKPGALAEVRKELDYVTKLLWEKYGFERKHRFWVRGLACAYVAGHLVRHMGLLDFNPTRIIRWAIERCQERAKGEFKKTYVQLLNEAMYDIWASTLVVDVEWKAKNMCQILASPNPNKGFYARRVRDSGRMYISRTWLYKWLTEHGVNRSKFIKDLIREHVIVNSNKFVTLGAGTATMHGGGQIMTVEIDMNHPAMSEALAVSERDVPADIKKATLRAPSSSASPPPTLQ